jgi:ribonuclease D
MPMWKFLMRRKKREYFKYDYIDSENKLSKYISDLKENKIDTIALDIEGESNLHQYGEKLCLVQIYDGNNACIIDPFKTPMNLIKQILENRSIMKIMFAAPGDRVFLYRNCGIDTISILDLQAAVLLLDYQKNDLSSVLKRALNIGEGKSKKRFQKYNWNKRPLDDTAIDYALGDVIHMFKLKDHLFAEIIRKGLLDKFILRNLQVQNKPYAHEKSPGIIRSSRFKGLSNDEKKILTKLFEIREKYAKKINLAPNSVVPNDILFEMAANNIKAKDIHLGRRIPEKTGKHIIEEMEKILNEAKIQ